VTDVVHPSTLPVIPEAWSIQQVADRLHLSEDTVRRLIAEGAFPGAFRVRNKLLRIPVTDLDAYQRRKRVLSHPDTTTTDRSSRALTSHADPPRRPRVDGWGEAHSLPDQESV
jgi:excisionase family DNA binding protein